jgi:Lrp/AsnC family transcriptional regulator
MRRAGRIAEFFFAGRYHFRPPRSTYPGKARRDRRPRIGQPLAAEDIVIDRTDRHILEILQEDGTRSVAEIAERVNLSTTPCWRRIQRLEQDGVIRRRVVLLDAAKLNVDVTVIVLIRTAHHGTAWLKAFRDAVVEIPEVVEVHRMSGQVDYLLKVVVPNIAAYDAVYKRLIGIVELHDVSSSFSMETIKSTTALPLGYSGGVPA